MEQKKPKKRHSLAVNGNMLSGTIRKWFPLFLLPTVAAFAIGFVYPFIKGIYLSFCNFKTTSNAKFVGLDNYIKALSDSSFMHSFWFTALFAIVSLVLINVIAFAVAYALTRGIKGSNIFRTVFFMPNLIGGIVLGYIWSMIFDGILSRYGTSILLDSTLGFWGLIILMCWQQIGYMINIHRWAAKRAGGADRGRKDRRRKRLADAFPCHYPLRYALHNNMHVPFPYERLQAV